MSGLNPDEFRVMGLHGPLFIRMLREREARIVDRMYGEFRNGKIDQLTNLAELATVRDLINEIESAIRALNK